METNEINSIIAKWLGLKIKLLEKGIYKGSFMLMNKNGDETGIYIDFLHDRNQQKWIEDKLMEKYMIDSDYNIDNQKWSIEIYSGINIYIKKTNPSKDLAFIQAVLELIKKEE